MTLTRRTFIAIAAAVTLWAAIPAPAQAADATAFVQTLGDKALTSLTAKDLPADERKARVRDLLRNNFDVQTIGRFVLGKYWKTATEEQKQEYFKLFEDMIVDTYSQRFAEYSGQSFKVGTSAASGKDSLVNSQILQKNGPPVNVQWRVRNNAKIVDVAVEGISMAQTQRSDFTSVIESNGGNVGALIDALKKREVGLK